MARKQAATIEALDEIQGAADRLAEWIREHLMLVIGVVVGLLVLAGGISFYMTSRTGKEQDAASALALAREEYLEAMGAGPGAFEVPELANPEAGARIRGEYAEKLENVSDSYAGTVAATLAELDRAVLARDAGEPERALEILEAGLARGVSGDALRGLTLQRVAQGSGALGRSRGPPRGGRRDRRVPAAPLGTGGRRALRRPGREPGPGSDTLRAGRGGGAGSAPSGPPEGRDPRAARLCAAVGAGSPETGFPWPEPGRSPDRDDPAAGRAWGSLRLDSEDSAAATAPQHPRCLEPDIPNWEKPDICIWGLHSYVR
jgi:predicted negative regulator of RcsB-dependent stress response